VRLWLVIHQEQPTQAQLRVPGWLSRSLVPSLTPGPGPLRWPRTPERVTSRKVVPATTFAERCRVSPTRVFSASFPLALLPVFIRGWALSQPQETKQRTIRDFPV
jgi:hypothetical protein